MATTSARMLSLLSLLQARRDWPGPVLADRLHVSGRTVRRDVDRLRELGYPIAALKGPDGGYRLEAGSELPPLLFDDDQAVALVVALQLLTTAGAGLEEAAVRAMTTLRQVMPARLRRRVDTLQVTTVPRGGATPELDPALLVRLADAVHAGVVLRFDYASSPDAPPRRAEPYALLVSGGRWYLLAWDLDRADWRTFRADRISPRTPDGPRFAPRDVPGGDVAAFARGRFRGATTGSDWPCRGSAVLPLPAEQVAPFARDGVVEPLADGRCRLTLGAWSWVALAAALGQYDAALDDVHPAELRDACATLAHRYAAATP